ncbi:MAG TPA: helix-turn-helix transcriptional regulator [Streptosporangiaceae bacterium]|nr:helix-turn-helix transcriptional regulator [Streptosporangiaceae bacterium]
MLVGPTIRRRRLGTDLRRLREARSLKLEYVASRLGVAPSTLSRIETGKAPTRTSYLTVMLELYGVEDPVQRQLMMELAREGQRKGWWADTDELLPAGFGRYLGLEAEASAVRSFRAQVIHGLLQTEDYARAVIAASRLGLAPEQVDRLVAVQLRRQDVLSRGDPIRLWLVLDESALLRSMGPPEVMNRQLGRLLEASQRPEATVQVLRLSGGSHPVLSGSFSVLSFAEPADPDVVCAEGIRGQLQLDERGTEVRAMGQVFDALSDAALGPADSADLIRDLAGR